MGTEIFKIDASKTEKLTKTRVSNIIARTVRHFQPGEGPSSHLSDFKTSCNSWQPSFRALAAARPANKQMAKTGQFCSNYCSAGLVTGRVVATPCTS